MLRIRDLGALQGHAPRSWRNVAVHLDPDLASPTPTYGDNCRRAGRAFSLRRAKPGDLIVFLARLHPADGRPGFHLVGALEVEDALEDVVKDPGAGWWDGNAHVRRARATNRWDVQGHGEEPPSPGGSALQARRNGTALRRGDQVAAAPDRAADHR